LSSDRLEKKSKVAKTVRKKKKKKKKRNRSLKQQEKNCLHDSTLLA
jgi:hypothetical protein